MTRKESLFTFHFHFFPRTSFFIHSSLLFKNRKSVERGLSPFLSLSLSLDFQCLRGKSRDEEREREEKERRENGIWTKKREWNLDKEELQIMCEGFTREDVPLQSP